MEVTHMVVKVGEITKGREAARKAADQNNPEAASILELRYIADSLEAIRGELVGLSHLAGNIASRPPSR
jgi:hypothetical protein